MCLYIILGAIGVSRASDTSLESETHQHTGSVLRGWLEMSGSLYSMDLKSSVSSETQKMNSVVLPSLRNLKQLNAWAFNVVGARELIQPFVLLEHPGGVSPDVVSKQLVYLWELYKAAVVVDEVVPSFQAHVEVAMTEGKISPALYQQALEVRRSARVFGNSTVQFCKAANEFLTKYKYGPPPNFGQDIDYLTLGERAFESGRISNRAQLDYMEQSAKFFKILLGYGDKT